MARGEVKKLWDADFLRDIGEYDYWVVLVRPQQVTAGSLILACKESAESMSELSIHAFTELEMVTK